MLVSENRFVAGRRVSVRRLTAMADITPEYVIAKVRVAGGRLLVRNVGDAELTAWRRTLKTAYCGCTEPVTNACTCTASPGRCSNSMLTARVGLAIAGLKVPESGDREGSASPRLA
jgi:hypothetical protein